MRIITFLITFWLLTSCAGKQKLSSFEFYNSSGTLYELSFATEKIKEEYGLLKKPKIVIVATERRHSLKLKNQLSAIYQVDAEELGFILILTNVERPDKSGYYAGKLTAKNILNGNQFRIVVFDETANAIVSSTIPINTEDLKKHLTKKPRWR